LIEIHNVSLLLSSLMQNAFVNCSAVIFCHFFGKSNPFWDRWTQHQSRSNFETADLFFEPLDIVKQNNAG